MMCNRLAPALLAAVSSLAPLLACSSPEPAGAESGAQVAEEGQSRAPIKLEAIAGTEWARCWVAPTGGAADAQDVICAGSTSATDSFAVARMTTSLSHGGETIASQLLLAGVAAPPQSHGLLPAQFPLTITLTVDPRYGAAHTFGASPDNDKLTAALTIASPADATKDHPIVFRQPFAIWPIAILEHVRSDDDTFAYVPATYGVPTAPFTTSSNTPAQLVVDGSTDSFGTASRQHVLRASLIAPPSGGIKVHFTVNLGASGPGVAEAEQDFVIDGPGIYIAEPMGLRKATATDSLPTELLVPEGPASAPGATPAPTSGGRIAPCDESRRPAADPDTTACGADGQRCCNPIPACQNSGKCTGALTCVGTQCFDF